jgi:CelD/BcsL family acetyltransferase involved in cellulose biosynthesis
MKVIIYSIIEEKLIDDWTSLWKNSSYANYTNSPQWFLSVVEAFKYKKFKVIAVYENEQLIGVAALIKVKKYGIDFYTVAPNDYVCGSPFLIDLKNNKLVSLLKQQLVLLGNTFLSNIPEEFISAFNANGQDLDSFVQALNYYLPIVFDSNGLVNIHKRNKLMREIRGIEENFTLLSYDGNTSEGFNVVFALDSQSRKQDRGYSAFENKTIKEFYENLGKNFKEYLQIHILYFKEVPIAYEIGFLIGKNYFGSQMAYISEYKQYSPGKVILVKVIDLLASKGIKMMNMGSGDSPVKKLVTEEKRMLYEVIFSQNKITRSYINHTSKMKKRLYNQIHCNIKTYTVYRKLRKFLS